jgi:CubicO group peptidase (beta-lactamase class C family)
MTLAFVIEEVSGQGIDEFLQEEVWDRLGMRDTGFQPAESLRDRIAPTEIDEAFRNVHVHGVVHDENAYAIGGVAGHAGLFSTAMDLAVLAQTLLDVGRMTRCERAGADGGRQSICAAGAGAAGPLRLVSEETVRAFTRRFDGQASRALGWDTPDERSSAGDYFTASAFGHTGFTGTSIWIDPELDMFVVLLTNRVNPSRDNTKHIPFRRAVHDGAALAITDMEVSLRAR